MSTLAKRFAAYSASLVFEDLAPEVVHEVKRRIIDSLGCAMGALDAEAEPCLIARRVAGVSATIQGATLLGTRTLAPPDWAAFANGCFVRYLDFNDTYLSLEPAHPSDNIAPMLAIAESSGASGRDLIVAITLAYEIQCRLCDAGSLRARGWDHVTYVALSTALGAARLLRLDAARAEHALNIAGVQSAALRQSRAGELSHWKAATVAAAARQGVFAALLAREGMTGPSPMFEGVFGFEKLVAGQAIHLDFTQWDAAMILRTSMKFWPAEYHSQSAIHAALTLRPAIGSVENIASVQIRSHAAGVEIIGNEPEKWRPENRETADHSLPYIVAAALTDGEISTRQFAPERFRDPVLLDLLERVMVEKDDALTALYPRAAANLITVRLRDGRTLEQRCDYAPGSAAEPLSDANLAAKFHRLADPCLGAERAKEVIRRVHEIDATGQVRELMQTLATA